MYRYGDIPADSAEIGTLSGQHTADDPIHALSIAADHHGINNSEIISHNIVGSGCLLGRGVGSAINLLPGHWPGGWCWSAGWVAGDGNLLFAAGFPNCTNCPL